MLQRLVKILLPIIMKSILPVLPNLFKKIKYRLIVIAIKELQKEAHHIAKKHGWWSSQVEEGTVMSLIHSEVSEALEAHRIDNPSSDKINVSLVEEELADVIIRTLDYCENKQYKIGPAIIEKIKYNRNRTYKGKKF